MQTMHSPPVVQRLNNDVVADVDSAPGRKGSFQTGRAVEADGVAETRAAGQDLACRVERLASSIDRFTRAHEWYRRFHWMAYTVVISAGLGLCALTAWLGVQNRGQDALVASTLTAFLVGLHTAFRYDSHALFHRKIAAASANLGLVLRLGVSDDREFREVLGKFTQLRKFAASSMPKDQALEVLRDAHLGRDARQQTGGAIGSVRQGGRRASSAGSRKENLS
jgi:hypothetical protein